MAKSKHREIKIWQWNCRGLGPKAKNLQFFINGDGPAVMALQEVKTIAKVTGYDAYVNSMEKPAVATLVSKNYTAIVHDTEQDIENVLIELVPKRRGRNESVFILNVYSRKQKDVFEELFKEAIKAAGDNALLILGDFNAAHESWGYKYSNGKGKKLLETIEEEGLSIENEVWNPTRTGGGRTSDTSPDLTICKNVKVKWSNTCENLGSDHYIIEIEMETDLRERSIGKTRHTNWEDFREDAELDGVTDPVVWAKKIKEVMKKNTREVKLTLKYPAADNKLMAMWDERRKLTRRWKRQRYNRKIGKRVTEMDRQIEEYAQQLARHNWEQRCEDMKKGKGLGNKDTWALLNYLVDPTKMRSEGSKTMQRIIHQFKGSDHELMEYVRQRYIPDGTRGKELPEYSGRPNQELDEEIRIGEVKAAAREARNSTPGRDGVTNGALRNLPEKEYRRLTDMFNEVWKQGKLPDEWKQSDIKFISKPGKKIGLENLRPISLTSAVGKLMERVVKNRLQPYIEENGFFHNAMFGFRPYLSTQDIFALLKENVLDEFPKGRNTERVVMAIDLKAAFDNVDHEYVMERLAAMNCGERTYNYVRDFLRDRKGRIHVGDLHPKLVGLTNKGTPQGAVISPLLFNIAMMELPKKLDDIDGLGFAFYADDVTLWVGSKELKLGRKVEILRQAVKRVEEHVKKCGLEISVEKSEILRLHGAGYDKSVPIEITVGGKMVPEKDCIRILGMWLQSNGKPSTMIDKIKTSAKQICGMIKRIANRKKGFKEAETLRIVDALIVSKMRYCLPYYNMTKADENRVDCILRESYKTALHLPACTPTEKLEKMGITNTFRELRDAVILGQKERWRFSKVGRETGVRLGYGDIRTRNLKERQLTQSLVKRYRVSPIPRHMHPKIHKERRKARADYYRVKMEGRENVMYTDAAAYGSNKVAVCVGHDGKELDSLSLKDATMTEAEEAAIAMAIRAGKGHTYILTDSQNACRNYMRGRVCATAAKILERAANGSSTFEIIWVPGHEGIPGNQAADLRARGYVDRAEARQWVYSDMLDHFKAQRRQYGLPCRELSKAESTAWRRIQAGNYTNPVLLKHMGRRDDDACKHCGQRATFSHMVRACPDTPGLGDTIDDRRWEEMLRSEVYKIQIHLINRTKLAASSQGIPD